MIVAEAWLMRALVGDKWIPGLLDPVPVEGELLVDVRAWITLRRVEGLHFESGRDWRRVLRYAREFGVRRVLGKIRSRLAERGRNDKFIAVGVGLLRASDGGDTTRAGEAVCFVAPAHPRAADRACVHASLVRPARPGFDPRAFPADRLTWLDAVTTKAPPAAETLAGWSPWSGEALDDASVDALLDAAPALIAAAPRHELSPSSADPVRHAARSPRAATTDARARARGALRAAVFGFGHYAKTNLIPNLRDGIEVTEIREIDPLQLGPIQDATRRWSVSTDPGLAETDRFDIVCAAGFHHGHAPLAAAALRSGAWALVEKPVATTGPQLEALLAAMSAHPGRLFACFHKRFDPLNDWARADLGVRSGQPIHYKAIVFEVPLPARHWYRWPRSGSRIVSNGCHWIDHFLFLNDWSPPVSSSATRAASGDITCIAELANGASLNLVLTDVGSARLGVRDHVELRAGDATVVIDDGASYRAERTDGVIRRATRSREDTYSRMYRAIGTRILKGEAGDSTESVARSTGLMLELEASMRAAPPRRGMLPVAALAVAALLASACGEAPRAPGTSPVSSASTALAPDPSRPPDLLLISVDTLRADRLGCYGHASAATPFIDSLAREGVLFRHATSAAPITLPSHATMLTGLYPARHGARDNTGFTVGDDIKTLAESLRTRGYQTGAFIGALPLARSGGLAQGFDAYDDRMPERALAGGVARREERTADEVLAVATAWLATTEASRPSFAFVHLFDPHSPYEKVAPGAAEPSYDGEVAFVDRSLEAFVGALRRDTRWRDLVIILTSDHGEGLGEHGEATHCIFVYESTMHVPLIVHAPGRFMPRSVNEVVGLVDLMPTIEEVAGVTAATTGARATPTDGRSLAPALRGEALPARDYIVESLFGSLNFGWAPLRGLRSGSLKLIDAPRPELFDLAADPREATNLHATRANDADRLATRLLAVARGSVEPQSREDRDRMEGLAALGYVSARPAAGAAASPADPKDRIADYDAFQRAHAEFASGRPEAGLATMQALEPRFSLSPYFYLELGNFAGGMGRLDEAERAYKRCLELEPGNSDARLNSGVIRLKKDDPRGALAHFEGLLAREPEHAEAHLYAGVVLGKRLGEEAAAIAHWRRFVELAPAHPEAAQIRAFLSAQPKP